MGRGLRHKIAQRFEGLVQLACLTLFAGEQKRGVARSWHSLVLPDERAQFLRRFCRGKGFGSRLIPPIVVPLVTRITRHCSDKDDRSGLNSGLITNPEFKRIKTVGVGSGGVGRVRHGESVKKEGGSSAPAEQLTRISGVFQSTVVLGQLSPWCLGGGLPATGFPGKGLNFVRSESPG
jgi:hypothetical protein